MMVRIPPMLRLTCHKLCDSSSRRLPLMKKNEAMTGMIAMNTKAGAAHSSMRLRALVPSCAMPMPGAGIMGRLIATLDDFMVVFRYSYSRLGRTRGMRTRQGRPDKREEDDGIQERPRRVIEQ